MPSLTGHYLPKVKKTTRRSHMCWLRRVALNVIYFGSFIAYYDARYRVSLQLKD